MARYFFNTKATVEQCNSISVVKMKQWGFFEESFRSGSFTWGNGQNKTRVEYSFSLPEKKLRLQYTFTSDPDDPRAEQDYTIHLSTTPCRYGGVRYWMHCPKCQRRVWQLFFGGKYIIVWWECWNFTYSICNASGLERRMGKILCFPDIDEEFSKLKRRYYRGKKTKKYKRLLRHSDKIERAFFFLGKRFGAEK